MDDAAVEDEKKPFDAEHGGQDDDTQPDPDENLMMESGNGRVWLVKVYNHLNIKRATLTQSRYHAKS
jgi:transcription initiation factor TFIIF subunit beta